MTSHRSGWLKPGSQQVSHGTTAPKNGNRRQTDVSVPAIAGPLESVVIIEVLDSHPGDYTIRVSDRLYCCSVSDEAPAKIAEKLADQLRGDENLCVHQRGARIVLSYLREPFALVSLDRDGARRALSYTFNRPVASAPSGAESPKVRRVSLSTKTLQDPEPMRAALHDKLAQAKEASHLDFTEAEWIAAGLLRGTDDAFDCALSKYEQSVKQEVIPVLTLNADRQSVRISPPAWVASALMSAADPDELLPDTLPVSLCPYWAKMTERLDAGDVAPVRPRSLWVQVSNAHGDLQVVAQPMPEEPGDDYRSPSESPAAFRPDFYVLALPLPQASQILWRTEKDQPGKLHGSLAEILDFDRRTSRRTATGTPIEVIRDADGRPPREHPLRDFAGIQYFFQNQVRIGAGHIYYPNAEWGLSSISQLAYWRERMSPSGPFIGQLSVDIGDFYQRAPARLGNRVRRSAWSSSAPEIAREVWFQVRQGMDRERAGILTAPSYYHLDQGLAFKARSGSVFRDKVAIRVSAPPSASPFTVWVNGHRFTRAHEPGDPRVILEALVKDIHEQLCESVIVEPAAPDAKPKHEGRPVDNAPSTCLLVLKSKVPRGAVRLSVSGGKPGLFVVSLRTPARTFAYSYIHSATAGSAGAIRDGLFYEMARDPDLPAIVDVSGPDGILLLPRNGEELPPVGLRNDHQQLRVDYGTTLRVRLEQCYDCLAFDNDSEITIADNLTPFLINVPNQWQYRPGHLHADDLTFDETVLRPGSDERIRYRISNKRWVAAGTYMATTTQLTTMESACESGRHAVNAILRCLARAPGTDYNSQGRVYGDLADIWDPEQNELADLEPLRRLDAKLAEEGMPHVMDILKITDAIDAIPMHGKPSNDPLANVLHLAQHLADGVNRDWGFARQGLNDLLGQAVERINDGLDPSGLLREMRNGSGQVAERIRTFIQGLFTPGGPGGGDAPKPQ